MIAAIGLCLLVIGFIVGKFENPLAAINTNFSNGCGPIGLLMKLVGLLALATSACIWLWRNVP